MVKIAQELDLWVVNIDEFPLANAFPSVAQRVLMTRIESGSHGYVKASDELRWSLGYLLGGLYLDGDTILRDPNVFEQARSSDEGWAVLVRDNEMLEDNGQNINNDAIIMAKGNPAVLHGIAERERVAGLTQLELFGDRNHQVPADLFDPKGNPSSGSTTTR